MATTERKSTGDTYRIAAAMDDDGAMSVRPLGRREEYAIVDYVDDIVRDRLATLEPGTAVRLEIAPTADDGDTYVATRVMPGTPGITV